MSNNFGLTPNHSKAAIAPPSRIFTGQPSLAIILPRADNTSDPATIRTLAEFAELLRDEHAELALELGAPVRFLDADPGHGPRWLIGPSSHNPAIALPTHSRTEESGHWFDRERQLLIMDAPDFDGIYEALGLLRTAALTGAAETLVRDCTDLDEAIAVVTAEVARTYPAFALRGLDWTTICTRHAALVRAASDPLVALQRWLAELGDAHTWVKPRPSPLPLPYALHVAGGRAVFTRVPPETAAWQAGVRSGDELLNADADDWWARTAAPPHARPLMTGYRLLASPPGSERPLIARSPAGTVRRWSETPSPTPPFPVVDWQRLSSGTGYLRIAVWHAGTAFEQRLDAAIDDLASCPRLIVDLRGNSGGNLVAARAFRDRFLRAPTHCGYVRYSDGGGGLAPPAPILGAPASAERRWHGAAHFLTDPLTYSASEDALLGLQGLPHIRVVGQPSGGGSGRPRAIRLLPGWQLMVSSALTYDRHGRCIEGAGIPVDRPIIPGPFAPDTPDLALLAADQDW